MQYSFWDDFGLPSFALSLAVASTCVYRVPGRVAGSAVAYRRHFVCFHLLLGLALLSHIAVTVRMITCFFTFYCLVGEGRVVFPLFRASVNLFGCKSMP